MTYLLFIESLAARLDLNDEEFDNIQEELYHIQAGLAGEEKLRYTLSDYVFKQDVRIFYDFQCLNTSGYSHQMDALVVTPCFTLIIECKHLSGTLLYQPSTHEFSRLSHDVTITNFKNPFDQALRHQLFLEHYFTTIGIRLPVRHVVVNTNLRAKLDASLFELPIFHVSGLPLFLEKLQQQYVENCGNLVEICARLEQLFCRLPIKRHVARERIRNGVLCVPCRLRPVMYYVRGYWVCPECGVRDKEAVLLSLQHYRLLISPHITNKAFREFVGISDFNIASKLLLRLGFKRIGKNRGAYYVIPEDVLQTKIK